MYLLYQLCKRRNNSRAALGTIYYRLVTSLRYPFIDTPCCQCFCHGKRHPLDWVQSWCAWLLASPPWKKRTHESNSQKSVPTRLREIWVLPQSGGNTSVTRFLMRKIIHEKNIGRWVCVTRTSYMHLVCQVTYSHQMHRPLKWEWLQACCKDLGRGVC